MSPSGATAVRAPGASGNQQPDGAEYRAAIGLCWLALFNIGAYTALFGPVLPELAERAGMRLGAVGAVVTALAGAATISTLVTGRLVDRLGVRVPLVVALVLNGTALALLPWAGSWPLLLALGALLGVGDGGIAVATHVLVGQARRGEEAAALNRLNVFFGLGAVLSPALAALVRALGLRAALLLVAVGFAQWLAAVLPWRTPAPASAATANGSADDAPPVRLVRSLPLWLLSVLLLVYVGLELGLGAWTFTYAREAAGLSAPAAALLSGGFWAALTLGRLLSPAALRRLTARALLVLGAAVAAGGTLILLTGGASAMPLIAGVLVVGLGFGPVWPVTFALAAEAFPAARGTASGILAMASALGAAGLPWVFGAVLDAAGPVALIRLTVVGALLLLALATVAARATRRPEPATA